MQKEEPMTDQERWKSQLEPESWLVTPEVLPEFLDRLKGFTDGCSWHMPYALVTSLQFKDLGNKILVIALVSNYPFARSELDKTASMTRKF